MHTRAKKVDIFWPKSGHGAFFDDFWMIFGENSDDFFRENLQIYYIYVITLQKNSFSAHFLTTLWPLLKNPENVATVGFEVLSAHFFLFFNILLRGKNITYM